MNEVEKTLNRIKKIYDSSPDEVKKSIRIYIQSIGKNEKNITKPTIDDYTTIRSYEDACEALGAEPIFNDPNPIMNLYGVDYEVPPHIITLMKLETISRALWGKDWMPEPDAECSEWFYYSVFGLYTQQEIENMDEDERGGLLCASAADGAAAGFGYLYTHYRSSNAVAYDGFRLCQETSEKAEYFSKQFIELWAEYLKFNFEVGGRLK